LERCRAIAFPSFSYKVTDVVKNMGGTSIGGTKALLTEHFLSVRPPASPERGNVRFCRSQVQRRQSYARTPPRSTGTAPAGISRNVGHTKLDSTVRYLGIEVDDGLEMGEQTEG
jgi:hypothetical protein